MKINIDVLDELQSLGVDESEFGIITEAVVTRTLIKVYSGWVKEASDNLTTARKVYVSSLKIVDRGRFSGSIVLSGSLVNMIESGAGPFDMKIGFSKSNKIKQRKSKNKKKSGEGWYLTIPYKKSTPTTVGEFVSNAGVLPKEIYNVVKTKPKYISLSIEDLPDKYQERGERKRIVTNDSIWEAYKHKSPIYEGLSKRDRFGRGSGYISFRRVSDKSDPNSWIHKGIKARNFLEKAIDKIDIEGEVTKAINKFL